MVMVINTICAQFCIWQQARRGLVAKMDRHTCAEHNGVGFQHSLVIASRFPALGMIFSNFATSVFKEELESCTSHVHSAHRCPLTQRCITWCIGCSKYFYVIPR